MVYISILIALILAQGLRTYVPCWHRGNAWRERLLKDERGLQYAELD